MCKAAEREKIIRSNTNQFEVMFPIVEIENVSENDEFMQYEPKGPIEKRIKNSIIRAKAIGMKDFRKPVMDPSFADDGETIVYCADRMPAVGKSAVWWYENAPKFMPEKNSRLMDDLEKDVFLGISIKQLVEEEKMKVQEAWEAVCVNSQKIGYYYGCNGVERNFRETGIQPQGKWFDLGSTYKIVKKREDFSFMLYGCFCYDNNEAYPLANARIINNSNSWYFNSVGEIVLDK